MSKYDLFFYGTVCHVCKAKGRVKRCSACKMIAYCSAAHQKEHWPVHRSICKCIQKCFPDKARGGNSFLNTKRECWAELMMLVELKLRRQLSPVERQMFWFARKCELCHEFEQDKLEDCEGCASASYCTDRNCRALDSQHATFCSQLNLSFELDKYLMKNSQPPFLLPPADRFSIKLLPCNIDEFVANMISEINDKGLSSYLAIPLYTEVFSCPLTLVYSLQVLQMREINKLAVHIVGAASVECSYIAYWEIVLHCLPHLRELFIFFIGPECWDQETKLQLCAGCRENGRSIKIAVYAQLYHEYVRSPEYRQPDLVVVFNCGLHETQDSPNDTWAPSVPLLLRRSPLVLTSYTAEEARQDINRLDANIEKVVDCKSNPYHSLRPHRDMDRTGSKVFYLNSVLSIVQKSNIS